MNRFQGMAGVAAAFASAALAMGNPTSSSSSTQFQKADTVYKIDGANQIPPSEKDGVQTPHFEYVPTPTSTPTAPQAQDVMRTTRVETVEILITLSNVPAPYTYPPPRYSNSSPSRRV